MSFNIGPLLYSAENYDVLREFYQTITNNKAKMPLYVCNLYQSSKFTNVKWSVLSLDLVLGLVGGITSIVWTTCALLIGKYEEFRF